MLLSVASREIVASDEAVAAADEFDRLVSDLAKAGFRDEFSADAWAAVKRGGWLSIGRPAEPGAERDDLCLMDLAEFAEIWGRWLLPGPYVSTVLAARWAGADVAPPEVGYTYATGKFRGKAVVPFGALAGITCLGRLSDGAAAQAVTCEVVSEDRFAPSFPLAMAQVETAHGAALRRETAVLHVAEAIGAASECLRIAVEYAMLRTAYGQEIGKFQAVRHRLADMHRDVEVSRGLLVSAANDEERYLQPCILAARLMKGVAEGAIQIHGGMGFTWEIPVHRYLRHIVAIQKLLYAQEAEGVPT
jgi:alkylation response protein AidB-like acyl-CoA dehydrogenase